MRREIDEMNLTAYALGELEGAERAAVETRLAASAEDRQFVEEVRAAARLVTDELARETTAGLDAIHYAAIELQLREPSDASRIDRRAVIRGRIGLAMSVAASIAIIVGAIVVGSFLQGRHHETARSAPTTQTLTSPILIPLAHLNIDRNVLGQDAGPVLPEGNPFVNVSDRMVSSFGMTTDTESYEDVRRTLFDHRLPPPASVRIEGLINAFAYDYPTPTGDAAFAGQIEVGPCPWQSDHRLARIAVKARPGPATVAEDVRTEVTFDPAAAKSYRLIGYEDASGAGARGEKLAGGHTVTALYEVVPTPNAVASGDLLTLSVRYRTPGSATQEVIQFLGRDNDDKTASADFRFAAAAAEFGMVLRRSANRGTASIDSVIELAEAGRGHDLAGERQHFIDLARRAKELLG